MDKNEPMDHTDLLHLLDMMFNMNQGLCDEHNLEEIEMFQENTGYPIARDTSIVKAVYHMVDKGYIQELPTGKFVGSNPFDSPI